MHLALRLGIPALVAGLTVVACASTAGSPGSPGPATSAPASSAAGTNTATVTIKGFAFSPTTITVAKGTKVTFDNQDRAAHTITSGTNRTKDGTFDQQLSGGTQTEIAFDTTGTFAYFCQFHSGMAATVVVN